MPRPRCGNDPRAQLTPGDRQAIADFRTFLQARAQEKTMTTLAAARADLEQHLETGDARTALERFEAAVRANERATPPAPMDETRAAELLAPLETKARTLREQQRARHRAEVLREAADAIEAEQAREEAEEQQRHGSLDHETVLQGAAVRSKAALLRRMANETTPKEA